MAENGLGEFLASYHQHREERLQQGIPPLPLDEKQAAVVTGALEDDKNGEHREFLLDLLDHRVPPGVYPASKVKADFLGAIVKGEKTSPFLDQKKAVAMLGQMIGGYSMDYLLDVLTGGDDIASTAGEILSDAILIGLDEYARVEKLAADGHSHAVSVLKSWASARWFKTRPPLPDRSEAAAVRTTGEINTDFLSPAQEAGTRDDIPFHALKILSTSPDDKDFISRISQLKKKNKPIAFIGDVVGTGSSRKSASNSLVWWIGDDIPHVPNKRRGGFVFASKIAPIFFNTLRGCGAVPVRCATGKIREGDEIVIDLKESKVFAAGGETLTDLPVNPLSILDEARAGGRNNLIIGKKLTRDAQAGCKKLNLEFEPPALDISMNLDRDESTPFTLGQKLVGQASGYPGVLPGDYVEPKAHMVFSQDTTGKMTQQEVQELACSTFSTFVIQSFCHTAAGPKSKDSLMQSGLGRFMAACGGIDLRPGDGVIHTMGNRFVLPYFIGTGGDSHTRFPVGLSFPAGSDLVAFAASQGYFPLDMPESVLVRFKGAPQPGITVRDLVHAIPYAAMQTGRVNLEKGDQKANVFADRVLEMEGLEHLKVEEAYKLTDASAERSAAGATFAVRKDNAVAYVENNLRFLKNNFAKRHPSPKVREIIAVFEDWLKNPVLFKADEGAQYADTVEVDLNRITEPLLAAPNDPDKTVTLSEAAGTPVDEVFIGSCMADITDFRGAAAILTGETLPHYMKLWTVPPDRESMAQLAKEGISGDLLAAGANLHVPGCSLCMGNQAQVAGGATVFSTSTRNFDNRMGLGARVYLGSSYVGAVAALRGRSPTREEYMKIFTEKVAPRWDEINRMLKFA